MKYKTLINKAYRLLLVILWFADSIFSVWIFVLHQIIDGPRQANLVLIAYASSEGSGSPEPSLLAHSSSQSRGTFRQKARSLAPLNGWACTVKICHDGMLEDTNSLDGAQIIDNIYNWSFYNWISMKRTASWKKRKIFFHISPALADCFYLSN